MKKNVHIVATIGPASSSKEKLTQLIKAGLCVARLNFSHGTKEQKKEQIEMLRTASEKVAMPLAIIADLQGPKLRLGNFDGKKEIKKGDTVTLSPTPQEGDIPLGIDISRYVSKQQRIYLNDGLVELTVNKIEKDRITVTAENTGWISAHKGLNIPNSKIKTPVLTKKDKDDLVFAVQHGVDYIALSFVQSKDDVLMARKLIQQAGGNTDIIVKIEKKEAVDDLEDIIEATDAVMVARGDLAIETKPELVPIVQQQIIRIARQHQKPVVIATQMLGSMTNSPRPTRAETSDVANAVLDQVDGVMLSEETASGNYPVEAVQTMHRIIETVEEHRDYQNSITVNWSHVSLENIPSAAIASSAVTLSQKINAKAIVVATATGRTAKLLAAFRPETPIIAAAYTPEIQRKLGLVWGVQTVLVAPSDNFTLFLDKTLPTLKETHMLEKGDKIVFITGSTMGTSGGTDTIKVVNIS